MKRRLPWLSLLVLAVGYPGCQGHRPVPTTSSSTAPSNVTSTVPASATPASASPAELSRSASAATSSPSPASSTSGASAASANSPATATASPSSTAPSSQAETPKDPGPAATQAQIKAKIVSKVQKIARSPSGPGLLRYPFVTAPSAEATRAINDSITHLRTSYYDPADPADEDSPLLGMRFTINHNGHGILSLTFETDWNGAYPSGGVAHRCYLLSVGEELVPERLFDPKKQEGLLAKLDALLQKEIAATRQKHQSDPEWADVKDYFNVHFESDDLKTFQVGSAGITFFYPYGIAHAWKAWEPPGAFLLSYSELEPFLQQDGPLDGVVQAAKARGNTKARD